VVAGLASEMERELARRVGGRAVADIEVLGAGEKGQPASRHQQLPALLQREPPAKQQRDVPKLPTRLSSHRTRRTTGVGAAQTVHGAIDALKRLGVEVGLLDLA
jgi:hypothetical protein